MSPKSQSSSSVSPYLSKKKGLSSLQPNKSRVVDNSLRRGSALVKLISIPMKEPTITRPPKNNRNRGVQVDDSELNGGQGSKLNPFTGG